MKTFPGKRFVVISAFLLVTNWLSAQKYPDSLFRSPVDIPIRLAGTFHELRGNHFHAGIDIKTRQQTGKLLRAIAGGYVYRISVSPGGYGRAIYIRHDTLLSVYGHLKAFPEEVEAFVKQAQYKLKSYKVNLFPPPFKFPVEQSDTVGFSGNSGSSAGPHLHFEIRDFTSEHPLNALNFGIDAEDNRPPVLYDLYLYNLKPGISMVYDERKKLPLKRSGRNYRLHGNRVLEVEGKTGFGIRTYDYLNNSYNKCGLYKVILTLDRDTVFHFQADEFAFWQTRYINSMLDRKANFLQNRQIMKLFREPHNKLMSYRKMKESGAIVLQDDSVHNVNILLADYAGNTSEVTMKVRRNKKLRKKKPSGKGPLYVLDYRKDNILRKRGIELEAPGNALYTNYFLPIRETGSNAFGRIYQLGQPWQVFHRSVQIKIDANLPQKLKDKAVILRMDDGERQHIPATFSNGRVIAAVRRLGNFSVGVDTIPPAIRALNVYEGKKLKAGYRLRFRIEDNETGIAAFNGFIDGKWVLMEYDAKYNLLYHQMDAELFDEQKVRNFQLVVEDRAGNLARYKTRIEY